MHRAKVFLTVCAGLFLLALVYHLGARSAGAQGQRAEAAVSLVVYPDALGQSQMYALASNGDLYHVTNRTGVWSKNSNIFSPDPPAKLPWADPPTAKTPKSR